MIVNKIYKVYWEHELPEEGKIITLDYENGSKEYPFRGKSKCTIDKMHYEGTVVTLVETIATGESWVHHLDTFDRKEGMKESLKKALADAPKALRTEFWKEFNRMRKPINSSERKPIVELTITPQTTLLEFLEVNATKDLNDSHPPVYYLSIFNNTLKFKINDKSTGSR